MDPYGFPPHTGYRVGKKGIRPDRPTLIFLHGAGGSALTFSHQIRHLDRSLNVLALELPGHGETPGPGRKTIAAYADWVAEALSPFPVERLYLGGHSLGGAVALELAIRSWRRAQGILLIATSAVFHVSSKILEGLVLEPEETLARINRWCFPPNTDPLLLQQSLELLRRTPIRVLEDDFQACNHFDRSAALAEVTLPTLILAGELDRLTPPNLSEALQQGIPHSRLQVMPNAGHLVMLEKPRAVNRAIETFVLEHSRQ